MCRSKDIYSLVGGPKYEVEVLTADIYDIPTFSTQVEQWIVYAGRHRVKGAASWSGFVISYESVSCRSFVNKIIPGVESIVAVNFYNRGYEYYEVRDGFYVHAIGYTPMKKEVHFKFMFMHHQLIS